MKSSQMLIAGLVALLIGAALEIYKLINLPRLINVPIYPNQPSPFTGLDSVVMGFLNIPLIFTIGFILIGLVITPHKGKGTKFWISYAIASLVIFVILTIIFTFFVGSTIYHL